MEYNRNAVAIQIGAVGCLKGPEFYHRWVQLCSPLDLTVFSDGALNKNRRDGAGYCVYRGSQEISSGQVPLGYTTQIYDAEIIGAVTGLRAACSHYMARYATNVTVCLDNEEAAIRLHTGVATTTSASRILEFQKLRESWAQRTRATAINAGQVQVRWIPSHQGIAGNERADILAKQACDLEPQYQEALIARARELLEDRYHDALVLNWERNAPKRYKDLNIRISSRMPPELLLLPRTILGRLLAARSGHGDFAAYHRRFRHDEAEIYCACGQEKSPEHPFLCQLNRKFRVRPRNNSRSVIEDDIKWTLSTSRGAEAFHTWCKKAKPFG